MSTANLFVYDTCIGLWKYYFNVIVDNVCSQDIAVNMCVMMTSILAMI